jgi:hypothetical protein
MKSYLQRVLLFLLVLIFAVPMSVTHSSATPISKRGQIAIEQIATCINSDGKNLLNVLYLIDESGSLDWNDPDNLRVQGIKRSLEQFRDVSISKPYFSINRAITTFGSAFTVRKPWEKISGSSLDEDLEWIDSNIPKLNQGKFTDWNQGLKGSYEEFQKVKSSASCNVMVWFTDGGVQVGNDPNQTRNSVAEVCGADPVTGIKTGREAIIDKFRKSGISIQGVLLRNQKYIDNPSEVQGRTVSKEDLENELARMSLFLPVIEQTGAVRNGAFSDNGPGTFNCGTFTGAGGVLQVVADAIDIIWPPIQFSCLANNGRVIPIINGQVKIDSALTRFSLTSPSKNFSLKNADGQIIATDQGAVKGDVKSNFINSSKTIIEISGKINSSNSVTKPGLWGVSSADLGRSVFCGYLDLGIDLKVGSCYVDDLCQYAGQITRIGSPVNLVNFQSLTATASILDNQGSATPPSPLKLSPTESTFQGSFLPSSNAASVNLKITLNVVTETGIEFTFSTIKPITVIPPGLYPEITPSPITSQNFSQGLVGKNGVAIAEINLKGPSRTNGQICLSALEVRSDVNPNRINGYESKLDGENLKDSLCFNLLAGSDQVYKFEVSNSESANGAVSGYMSAVLKADGQPDTQIKVDVEFQTSTLVDQEKFMLTFIFLMILGLALPLALLSIINSRNSRLVLDNVYKASVPVYLTASGDFVNLKRVEKGKSNDLLSSDDFSPFSSGKEIVRSKQIGAEVLTGKAPKNPFGNLLAKISTNPGQVITSSAFVVQNKKFQANEAQGALNPSGLMFVTLTNSANETLKSQNQGADVADSPVQGNLTALLSLNTGDPVAQVDLLNTRIMHEGGWLNNLLSITDEAPNLKTKPSLKKGKAGAEKLSAPAMDVVTDDWGSDTSVDGQISRGSNSSKSKSKSMPDTAKIADDWGDGSNSSDWDTPGPSNNSESKEQW